MRSVLRSSRTRVATSWWLVLAIVFGTFLPGWHALTRSADSFDPALELCSIYGVGVQKANPADSAPASDASARGTHCTACPAQLLAGLPVAETAPAVVVAAMVPLAPSRGAPPPESAPQRWAAPRGPPAQA